MNQEKPETLEEELVRLGKLRNIVNGSDVSYQHVESAPDLAAIDRRMQHIEALLAFRVHTGLAAREIDDAERTALDVPAPLAAICARIDAALANVEAAERRLAETRRLLDIVVKEENK